MQELERVREAYEKRIENKLIDQYSLFTSGELYMLQARERKTLATLKRVGLTSLAGLKVLEVGCGRGHRLADIQRWGGDPSLLHGVDYVKSLVDEASRCYSAYNICQASGHQLPYGSGSFDMVIQSTVFTSILDDEVQRLMAQEMLRVLKPAGFILWYDFRYPNPWNRDVRPITKSRIRELFPDNPMLLQSITLIPPIARRLARISYSLCRLLESIPFFRSHYLGIIHKSAR